MIRRCVLPAYWLLFALYTLHAGRFPGFVADPSAVPYPWRGVAISWVMLAVATGILHLILRPHSFRGQWTRIGGALLYALALLLLSLATFVTDMPGYVYVPGTFAIVTFFGLVLLAAATVIWRFPRSSRSNAPPPSG